jgi:hypothetical protein
LPAAQAPRVADFVVDVQRTCLQERFFGNFSFENTDDLIAAVADMEVGLDSISRSKDASVLVYSGWVYWFLFLKGYLQYREAAEITDTNIYFNYLVRYYAPRGHDPGISTQLLDVNQARERVRERFENFDVVGDREADVLNVVEPIVVTVSDPMPHHPLRVYPVGAPDALGGRLVDGWHRLFSAKIAGCPELQGQAVFEGEAVRSEG